jgi:hypothetical protein
LADATIQDRTAKIAQDARAVLLDALATVEAGETLPGFVRDFLARLNTVAPLLSYDTAAARIWNTQAAPLLARLAPFLCREGQNAAGNSNTPGAGENAPRGPRYYLPTTKSREELARIFQALKEARYIEGATPEALPDFLNAFAQGAESTTPQGRISWIWKAKNGQVSPLQILDFAARITGREENAKITRAKDAGFIAAVCAIFGVSISASVLHRYNFPDGSGTETSADIARIIESEQRANNEK